MISHNWSPMKRLIWLRGSGITGGSGTYETITGNPVSFTAKAAPLRKLEVAFAPKQDLHGYDSPWPAGGGVNKWDEETELGTLNTTTGEETASTVIIRTKEYIPVVAGETYRFITKSGVNEGVWMLFYDSNHTVITERLPSGAATAYNARRFDSGYTFTAPTGCAYVRWYFQSKYGVDYQHDTSLNYPSSVTTYSPYSNECPILGWDSLNVYHSGADTSNPQTISITLGSTVYSGTVDVVTGVVTVTMVSVDLGELSWTLATDSTVRQEFRSGGVKDDILTVAASVAPNAYCTIFVPASRNNQTSGTNPALNSVGVTSTGLLGVVVPPNSYADKDVFKTAMSGVQLVYELAEPFTIQLTPQEVESLAGDNTMWTDAASLEVTYRSN